MNNKNTYVLTAPDLSIIRSFVKHQYKNYDDEWDDATTFDALLYWLYYH